MRRWAAFPAGAVFCVKRQGPFRELRGRGRIQMSKSISRVLYLTVIYLDASLPVRSSHLLRTAGQAMCSPTVLLRIEFTAVSSSHSPGELLPRLSTLTSSSQAPYPSLPPYGESSFIPLLLLFRKEPLRWVLSGVGEARVAQAPHPSLPPCGEAKNMELAATGGISLLHFS